MKSRDIIIVIRDEIRKARTDGLNEIKLDDLAQLLDCIEVEIDEEKDAHELKMDHWRHVLSTKFDTTSKYANLVTVVGYGAFLTIWTSIRKDISDNIAMWSLFCIIASAVVYIFDEVFSQMKEANDLKSDAELYLGDVDEFLKKKKVEKEKKESHNIARIVTWHFVFWWTTITGLIAVWLLLMGIVNTVL